MATQTPPAKPVQKLQREIPTWTGTEILPCIPEPVCLLLEMGTFRLCLFQKTKRRGQTAENKPPPHTHTQAQTNRQPVNCIEDHQRDSNSGSDTEYVFHTEKSKKKKLPYFDLSFGDGHQMFSVLSDSGATINILSEADYKSLILLRPTKTVKSGFGVKEATPVLGQFSTLLKFRGISCQADIHVIKNPEKPIIGWEKCKRFKLLSANTHSVNHISNSDAQTPLPTLKLLEDYTDLFDGLGKLKEKKKFTYT